MSEGDINSRLQDGKEGREEGELDAGDGFETEETVFDLGEELGVGGVFGIGVWAGGVEGDVGDVARWDAGDVGSGGVGVGGEGGGADEAGVDDVAAVGEVAVAEEEVEVGGGHGCEIYLRGFVGGDGSWVKASSLLFYRGA
jgi:hypothetical protein